MLSPGERAPGFKLPLLGDPGSAGAAAEESLEGFLKGGAVLLAFVKEGCPTCRFALPFLERIHQNYPGSRVSILVVAQEEEAKAREMVENSGIRMPVLLDRAPHPVSRAFGLEFVPTFFLIARSGLVEEVVESFSRSDLERINRKIAAGYGLNPAPWVQPLEDVPEFRPG